MKNILIISTTIFLLTSFTIRETNKPFSYTNFETPPGTIKIQENFYVDANEIRNIDYLEFTTWTKEVYTPQSPEYHKIYPDTNVWLNPKLYNAPYTRYYLTHPAYRNYPVVGITTEQAQAFCKWRSDRVMEFLLIREGIIPNKSNRSKDSCFTIERYFNGMFGKVNPNEYLTYYPEYSLIDTTTYLKIAKSADSLNTEKLKHSFHKNKVQPFLETCCNNPTVDRNDVTQPPPPYYKKIYQGYIYNLKGNVRELTADKNIAFGGSFIDSYKTIMETNFYPNAEANSYTGFRCMCKYKKWKNK